MRLSSARRTFAARRATSKWSRQVAFASGRGRSRGPVRRKPTFASVSDRLDRSEGEHSQRIAQRHQSRTDSFGRRDRPPPRLVRLFAGVATATARAVSVTRDGGFCAFAGVAASSLRRRRLHSSRAPRRRHGACSDDARARVRRAPRDPRRRAPLVDLRGASREPRRRPRRGQRSGHRPRPARPHSRRARRHLPVRRPGRRAQPGRGPALSRARLARGAGHRQRPRRRRRTPRHVLSRAAAPPGRTRSPDPSLRPRIAKPRVAHRPGVPRSTPVRVAPLLRSRAPPSAGGHTAFADCTAAYESLPETTRASLADLRAVCSYAHHNAKVRLRTPTYPLLTPEQRAKHPPCINPSPG